MLIEIKKYIAEKNLFFPKDKLLLALSGGIDSIVLFDLLKKMNLNFAAAHCNFNLRGDESDGDEAFVTNFCAKQNVELFKISFQTKAYAEKNKISIQMAARELRYNWFEEIYKENNFDYILSAHHADDVVETFHINLARGTGIKGLSGIKAKIGNLIRPILFSSRKEIEKYKQDNELKFREDSSNSSTKYARNKIRHQVIPALTEINSAYSQNVISSIDKLNDIEKIYFQQIEEKRKEIITKKNDSLYIGIEKLEKTVAPKTFLYEFVKEFGFSSEMVEQIYQSINNQAGKEFYSENYVLLKNRNEFIIQQKQKLKKTKIFIEENSKQLNVGDLKFLLTKVKKDNNFKIERKSNVGLFDLDKLQFPLELNNWKQGDYFYPLGMEKRKKLSDFFIDKKYSLFEKENQLLLKSEENIIWIVSKQIDNRFKITEATKNILRIEISD